MAEKLLSANEVAERLGICRGTVYSLVHRKLLPPPLRIGGASRWTELDIETMLSSRRRGLLKPKRPGEPRNGNGHANGSQREGS